MVGCLINENQAAVCVDGDIDTIIAELCLGVRAMWLKMDEKGRAEFKERLCMLVSEDSPVFMSEEALDELTSVIADKISKEVENMMNETLSKMEQEKLKEMEDVEDEIKHKPDETV